MDSWVPVVPEPDDYAVSGIDIDGARYGLEGQPDIAVSHGWLSGR
jgi:hypothetical protein